MDESDIQVLHRGKYLWLVAKGTWEFARRPNASGVVGILAVTAERKLLLVEQFRAPVGVNVIELPAGLAGDLEDARDEDLSLAARRELLEETGYEAGEMAMLSRGPSSAGLTDETVVLYRATGLKKVHAGGGDASERITVHEIPVSGLRQWLNGKVGEGAMIDFKVWAAFAFLES